MIDYSSHELQATFRSALLNYAVCGHNPSVLVFLGVFVVSVVKQIPPGPYGFLAG
jgi:hypothetical protein